MKLFRRFYKIGLVFITVPIVFALQLPVIALAPSKRLVLPRYFHAYMSKVLGVKVIVRGAPATDGTTLFVSNHLSYLDIFAIGGIIRQASFVAKSDIESWPVFGWMCKLQDTHFIVRSRKEAKKETAKVAARLKKGHSLIAFPEGTSSRGDSVLPFKSSFFASAYRANGEAHRGMRVQPFTVRLVEIDGRGPTKGEERDLYAWWRPEDDFGPHFWKFAALKGATLELHFHDLIAPDDYKGRKELSEKCFADISAYLLEDYSQKEG